MHEFLLTPHYSVLKRAFDVAFSLGFITLAAPFMLLIAVAIKATSPGPALLRVERIDLNGRSFMMYRFRILHVQPTSENDLSWTIRATDYRRTKVGDFLRTFDLDELPAFFNVLKGDMSVVGPRPTRPGVGWSFDGISSYNAGERLKVGITGWAQINGRRGDASFDERIKADLYYLNNWNFRLDLRIVMLTILSRLYRKSAY